MGTGRLGRRAEWIALAGFVAAVAAVAAIGGLVTAPSVGTWYPTLVQPWFTPPNWLFAPVWTALYLTIALAGWLAWRRAGFRGAPRAFILYGLQLVLNLAWSLLFFGLHRIGLALVDLAALWLALALTIAALYRITPAAGLLLGPYAAWSLFAGVLNAAIWWLN